MALCAAAQRAFAHSMPHGHGYRHHFNSRYCSWACLPRRRRPVTGIINGQAKTKLHNFSSSTCHQQPGPKHTRYLRLEYITARHNGGYRPSSDDGRYGCTHPRQGKRTTTDRTDTGSSCAAHSTAPTSSSGTACPSANQLSSATYSCLRWRCSGISRAVSADSEGGWRGTRCRPITLWDTRAAG